MSPSPNDALSSVPPCALGGVPRLRAHLRRSLLVGALWRRDASRWLRRALDLAASAVILALALPVLIASAIAIKLTSPGPVLFLQERIGRHGRPFTMLKLRTMRLGADAMKSQLAADGDQGAASVRFKMKWDPRITPVGRVLRKLSVDELPQIVNVLLGDMTLVGPRPPLGSEVARYDAQSLRRLEVTQGLTCLWQIGGRSDLPFERQVALDLEYIDRASFADDLRILIRTVPAVLSGRGAY
jgi:lipopolysaccharide/colanic/teichoic acid biosynthesis glycosyltransferase